MALINIVREDGTPDQVDESLLVRADGCAENDNEIATFVEYRFPNSEVVVHRSVHVQLKKWPEGMGALAADLQKQGA